MRAKLSISRTDPFDGMGIDKWCGWSFDGGHGAEAEDGVSGGDLTWRLRAETTMSLKWIAEHVGMGSVSMVAHCLREKARCEKLQLSGPTHFALLNSAKTTYAAAEFQFIHTF